MLTKPKTLKPFLSTSYWHLKYLSRLRPFCCPHLFRCRCQLRYPYSSYRQYRPLCSYDPQSHYNPRRLHALHCLHCLHAQCFSQCLAVKGVSAVRLDCKVFVVCDTSEVWVFRAFLVYSALIINLLYRQVHNLFVTSRQTIGALTLILLSSPKSQFTPVT